MTNPKEKCNAIMLRSGKKLEEVSETKKESDGILTLESQVPNEKEEKVEEKA